MTCVARCMVIVFVSIVIADTAREIYRNATIGQVEILQHLNEREEQLQEYSRRSDLFLQVYPAFSR